MSPENPWLETSGELWFKGDRYRKTYKHAVFSGKEIQVGSLCELIGAQGTDTENLRLYLTPINSLYFRRRLSHYTDMNNRGMLSWMLDPGTEEMRLCDSNKPPGSYIHGASDGSVVMVLGYSTCIESGAADLVGSMNSIGCQLRLLIDGEYDCYIELDELVAYGYSLEGLT